MIHDKVLNHKKYIYRWIAHFEKLKFCYIFTCHKAFEALEISQKTYQLLEQGAKYVQRKTRTRCKVCPKLTIEIAKQISGIVLLFLLLILSIFYFAATLLTFKLQLPFGKNIVLLDWKISQITIFFFLILST